MTNPNFSALIATTLKNYQNTLADNITAKQALFRKMKQFGGIREDSGGTTIVEPLMVGTNSTVASYNGYDVIAVTPQEGISAAEYDWKQLAGSVSISGREEFINNADKTRIINLLKAKIEQLEMSLAFAINSQMFLDGTANSGKNLGGLSLLVEDGAAWSTVGGIDSNANTYWRNQYIDNAGSFAANGIDNMRTLFNSCGRQGLNESVDLIIATQSAFEAYEKSLAVNERFEDKTMGDAGFKNLLYKGTPMVFDSDLPLALDGTASTHAMYMLITKYIKLVIGKGRNFTMTPFQKPDNQDAKVAQVLFYANMTTNNRARQGILDGIVIP